MENKRFFLYNPSLHAWFAATGPNQWTTNFSLARSWADFYEARDFGQTLPEKYVVHVTEAWGRKGEMNRCSWNNPCLGACLNTACPRGVLPRVIGRPEGAAHPITANMNIGERFAIGTRAMIRMAEHDYRVVCATCETGGVVRHSSHAEAFHAAARDSNKPCQNCGAR